MSLKKKKRTKKGDVIKYTKMKSRMRKKQRGGIGCLSCLRRKKKGLSQDRVNEIIKSKKGTILGMTGKEYNEATDEQIEQIQGEYEREMRKKETEDRQKHLSLTKEEKRKQEEDKKKKEEEMRPVLELSKLSAAVHGDRWNAGGGKKRKSLKKKKRITKHRKKSKRKNK
tara:strand:+ start:172 stop:678 length:507 start_codon:yes stop_codon:yes gene_type:complete